MHPIEQNPILTLKNLTTELLINHHAYALVSDLSFNLYPGKTLAIVGESGSGKTLTALSIMRILPTPPALHPKGQVLFNGENLLTLSEKEMRKIRGGKISMIFQDPMSSLNPVYTVGYQLIETALLHLEIDEEEATNQAIEVLKEVGMPNAKECLEKYPHQLSGGMRQRVMIAMALISKPSILIADEPTTALDVTIQAQILKLIRSIQKKRGLALLLITHDMGVVAEMADEVLVMYAAQNVEQGSILQIFYEMAHPYTIGLFNSRPNLHTPRGKLYAIKGSIPPATHYPTGCRFHPRCPFVMEKCRTGKIPYFSLNDQNSHEVLCLLYDNSEESLKKLQEKHE